MVKLDIRTLTTIDFIRVITAVKSAIAFATFGYTQAVLTLKFICLAV
jgi:hypothetical protein